jgi:hypothetical protein
MDETAACQGALSIWCKELLVGKSIAIALATAVVEEVS